MNVQYITNNELDTLIAALIEVESGGDDRAVGTRGEVGCLQISKPVVEDYNYLGARAHMRAEHQFMIDRDWSIQVCKWYLRYYGERVWVQNGLIPNFEILAKIWNGGPKGYLKPETQNYWLKVNAQLELNAHLHPHI